MKRTPIFYVLISIALLVGAGCQADPADPTDESSQYIPIVESPSDSSDQADPASEEVSYPAPEVEEPLEVSDDVEQENAGEIPVDASPYPGPEELPDPEPEELPTVVSEPYVITKEHDYSPVGGDVGLARGNVFLESSDIVILESFPMQVRLNLLGNLPTPCHHLRAVVSNPEPDGDIHIEVYSVTDPEMMCVQVLHPFEAIIPIGDFTSGSYVFYVNGEPVGDLDL